MQSVEYKNIYKNESTHFFYVSVHSLVKRLIEQYSTKKKHLRILDAGCGTGMLAKRLNKLGHIEAFDYSMEAIKLARKRGLRPKEGSVEKIPFRKNSFDIVTCIDVLYHSKVRNDKKALSEIFRVLKNDGLLILRVQANKYLTSSHDIIIESARRYSKRDLIGKMIGAGFVPIKVSYMHMTLFPLACLKALADRTMKQKDKPDSSISKVPEIINNPLKFLLGIENKLLLVTNLPFGVGIIAVGKKPIGK